MLFEILQKSHISWAYPLDSTNFSKKCPNTTPKRIKEFNAMIKPLAERKFPMSVIVNEIGAVVAEDFLTPISSELGIFRNRERKTVNMVVICHFNNADIPELTEEYKTLYRLLDSEMPKGMILPKRDRIEFYSKFVPNFKEYLSAPDRRGGDRKTQYAEERRRLRQIKTVTISELLRIINLLFPNALNASVVQRDIAELRSVVKYNAQTIKKAKMMKSRNVLLDSNASFDRQRYLAGINNKTYQELELDLKDMTECIQAIRDALRPQKRPTDFEDLFKHLKVKDKSEVERTIAKLRENIVSLKSNKDFEALLKNLFTIVNSGNWNADFPVFLPGRENSTTKYQCDLLELILLILKRAQNYQPSFLSNFVPNISTIVLQLGNHGNLRMLKICSQIRNL